MAVTIESFEAGHWLFIAACVIFVGTVLMEVVVWWFRHRTVREIRQIAEKASADSRELAAMHKSISEANLAISERLTREVNDQGD